MTKLCLGTVQFGMEYGINNQIERQPTWEESFEMLDYAFDNGINTIDTARAYGEAELVLGEYFKTHPIPIDLKVISKLRPNVIEQDEKDIQGVVIREIEDSLKRMNLGRLDGYLLHTPEYIYQSEIVESLQKLKDEGLVDNIGVSIYDLKEGYAAIDTGIVDYIQLPYSILDQRGIKSGFIQKAKDAGITIFTRSAFLQGLFMMGEGRIPEHLVEAIPYLRIFEEVRDKYKLSKTEAILHFVKSESNIDYLVFGVEKKKQLEENIEIFDRNIDSIDFVNEIKRKIGDVEKGIIFPSLWSNGKKAE